MIEKCKSHAAKCKAKNSQVHLLYEMSYVTTYIGKESPVYVCVSEFPTAMGILEACWEQTLVAS
jgi:hypothetical protein